MKVKIMDNDDILNSNTGKININPMSDIDLKSFLANYGHDNGEKEGDLSERIKNGINKLDRTPNNVQSLADYKRSSDLLKDNGRVIINKGFKGISSFLYDTLDKFVGNGKESYSRFTKENITNPNIERLNDKLIGSNFEVFDYSRQVELVQNRNKKFVNKGKIDEQKYSLDLGNTTLKVEVDSAETYVQIEITNRYDESLKFKIDKSGKVSESSNNPFTKQESLKLLEAYKPFLLQLNENNSGIGGVTNGYEKTRSYSPPANAPAMSSMVAQTYR
jgi:hypothetical protein